MLILLDETVQQVRITPAKTASNCSGLGFHRIHEAISYGVHATRIYVRGDRKDARWETLSYSALSYSHSARYRKIPVLESAALIHHRLLRSQETSNKVRGSVHYICIQYTFLLEVMRHGILREERSLDLNLGTDPFTLRMRCINRVVACPPAPRAPADRRTFNLIELPEVTPHFIANSAGNVDLQFYNRHEVPPQSSRDTWKNPPNEP